MKIFIKNNRKSIFWCVLIVAWLAVIWGNSSKPAVESTEQSGRLLMLINRFAPWVGTGDDSMYVLRKCAHFTEYTILGMLNALECSSIIKTVFSSERAKDIFTNGLRLFAMGVYPAMLGLLCAMIDETIQLFTPGRSSEIIDVWIDFSGVTIGVVIILLLAGRKWYNKRNTD